MRSWHIERLDPTVLAKGMLRDSGVECIGRKGIFALKQAEILVRHEQMQESAHVANAAVTPSGLNI